MGQLMNTTSEIQSGIGTSCANPTVTNSTAINSNGILTTSGNTTFQGYVDTNIDNHWKMPVIRTPSPISIIEDGKITMNTDNIHIQPTNNGFMVILITIDDTKTYTFSTFNDVLKFLDDNPIMDLDSSEVAENL